MYRVIVNWQHRDLFSVQEDSLSCDWPCNQQPVTTGMIMSPSMMTLPASRSTGLVFPDQQSTPGLITCRFVRINPRTLSTTKPVAYDEEATSVSNDRVCVTLRLVVILMGNPTKDFCRIPAFRESTLLEHDASRDNVVQRSSPACCCGLRAGVQRWQAEIGACKPF